MTIRSTPRLLSSLLSTSLGSLLTLASPASHAQQEDNTLPAVNVTGQSTPALERPSSAGSRLELSPMETPSSIDVITREQLDERGDRSLNGALSRSVGVADIGHPGNSGAALAVRGFSGTTSIMQLLDGTRQYGGVGLSYPFDTWAVDHVEVLRGPASVVQGDGAIGGVVNVVPKKPTRGPIRNEVQATVGTQGHLGLALGSGGRISDMWSYRVDLSTARADGWVDRGRSRNQAFSGAIQFDPTSALRLTLSHAEGRQEPMRYFGTPMVNGEQLASIARRNYNVEDSMIRYKDRWTELAARWLPADDVVVRSKLYHIQSDRYWRNAEGYKYNAGTGRIDRSDSTEIRHDQTQIGNTTDASVQGRLFGLSNRVSAGFDVNRASFRHTNNTYTGSSGSVDLYDPVPGYYASNVPFIPRYENQVEQYALFAEDRLELSPRWSVIGGLRRDHARVSRSDLVSGTASFERTYASTGWRLGTVFMPRPDLSLFAQYSRAADPVSALLMLSPANAAFESSTGQQFEIGIKQSLMERKGEWTLSAFSITKNNLLTRDPNNASLRQQVGQRSSRGMEGTLSMALSPTVRVDANVSWLRARYDDFNEAVGGAVVSRNGNVPVDVPQRLANVWMSWKFVPDWTLAGGARYVGRRYADNANTLVLPAYTNWDMALRWAATRDTTVSLRAFNLTDRLYYTTEYYTATQWFVGERRRFELSVHHRF